MLRLELAERIDMIECDKCGTPYRRVYGTIYEDEQGLGIYSADLHTKEHDLRVLPALGMRYWDAKADAWATCSCTIEVWPTDAEYQMAVRDAAASPYRDGHLMGRVLDREELLARPERDGVFHMADHIVTDDPRVRSHLDGAGE